MTIIEIKDLKRVFNTIESGVLTHTRELFSNIDLSVKTD